MRKTIKVLLIICTLLIISCKNVDKNIEKNQVVDIDNYVDYSYVGYKYSEEEIPSMEELKVFDVTDYGAIPDDDKSDEEGIRRAIEAAIENGSGVVYLPKGKYLVNTDEENPGFDIDDYDTFRKESPFDYNIPNGNIIIRGEKNAKAKDGGTEIVMVNPLGTETPELMYTPPYLFQITGGPLTYDFLGKPLEVTNQGKFEMKVSNIEKFEVGMWINLSLDDSSKELLEEELQGKKAEKSWSNILREVKVRERHKIVSIDIKNEIITFKEPLKTKVDPNYNWRLQHYKNASNIGIENIYFRGMANEYLEKDNDGKFVHHKNFIHDSGWHMIALENITDSWVKNSTFENFSRVINLRHSAAVSFLDIQTLGSPSHACITVAHSMGVLVAGLDERSSAWHAAGVQGRSIGNVFWRNRYNNDVTFESHAGQPRYTLFDNVEGGLKKGHFGGAKHDLPNHLKGLTLWNFKQTNKAFDTMEFWQPGDKSNKVVNPRIIGLNGYSSNFYREQLKENISQGKPVEPESLFEAQLIRRLGYLPKLLETVKNK